ncbi:MAG: hypothetical protein ACREYC_27885, partial [Gammaproteobacteria bacterium]
SDRRHVRQRCKDKGSESFATFLKEDGHEHDANCQRDYWEVKEMKQFIHLKRGDAYETLFCGGRLLNGPAYCVA